VGNKKKKSYCGKNEGVNRNGIERVRNQRGYGGEVKNKPFAQKNGFKGIVKKSRGGGDRPWRGGKNRSRQR